MCPVQEKAVRWGSAGSPINDIIDPRCESGKLEDLWIILSGCIYIFSVFLTVLTS